MQIGALAERSGMSAKTIRYYEQRGLLPAPPRTPAGYRDYSPQAVQRLRFIQDAQSAGLSLAEIGGILALRDSGQAPCDQVSALLATHLDQIERRLTDLRATRTALRQLARRAADVDPDTCDEAEICTILSLPDPDRRPDRSGPPAPRRRRTPGRTVP